MKTRMRARHTKAEAILSAIIFFFCLTTIVLILAHFIQERHKAIRQLIETERMLHEMHEADKNGIRHWDPIVDEPASDPLELSRRRTYRKHHHVWIDF